MEHIFLLAAPRLHAELADLPDGCRTFWPGFPDKPEHGWQPEMPWKGPVASACLEDIKRTVLDGALGSPVAAVNAGFLPTGLSEAEIIALQEMTGKSVPQDSVPLKQIAQHLLMLVWIQEKQALDMTNLEYSIAKKRSELNGILFGRKRLLQEKKQPDEGQLPPWQASMAAILAFLPDIPIDSRLYINSSVMAQTLMETGFTRRQSPQIQNKTILRVRVADLCGMCLSPFRRRLLMELSSEQRERELELLLPENEGTA
ncbi:MAG: hypothetical protein J6I40_07405 [Mailhella sp.]|nr:hypothetical protein [Mailhella sp.]